MLWCVCVVLMWWILGRCVYKASRKSCRVDGWRCWIRILCDCVCLWVWWFYFVICILFKVLKVWINECCWDCGICIVLLFCVCAYETEARLGLFVWGRFYLGLYCVWILWDRDWFWFCVMWMIFWIWLWVLVCMWWVCICW